MDLGCILIHSGISRSIQRSRWLCRKGTREIPYRVVKGFDISSNNEDPVMSVVTASLVLQNAKVTDAPWLNTLNMNIQHWLRGPNCN